MKTNNGIIWALVIGLVVGLTTVYGFASEDWKSYSKGTAFDNHRDGTYGPEGAGGYGMPDLKQPMN